MSQEQPNYLDFIRDMYTDPQALIPAAGAGLTVAGSALYKNKDKIGKAISAARPIQKAATSLKVADSIVRPRVMNKVINPIFDGAKKAAPSLFDPLGTVIGRAAKPLVTAMRPMTDPIAQTVSAIGKTPVGNAVKQGANVVGKTAGFLGKNLFSPIHQTLYKGAGGMAHRIVDIGLGSSPAGPSPTWERNQLELNRRFDNISGLIKKGLNPGYLSGLSENAELLHLSRTRDLMNDLGYDPRVTQFALSAMADPSKEGHSFEDVRQMLLKHQPKNNTPIDPRFAKTNDLGNLLGGLTFGGTDFAANMIQNATGNAFPGLEYLKTSNTQIGDAMQDDYMQQLKAYNNYVQEQQRRSLTQNQRNRRYY